MKAILFAVALGIGGAVNIAACSDSQATLRFIPDDASAGDASVPDVRIPETGDAASPDAALPYDGTAPEVVCAVTPCVKRVIAGPSVYCAIIDDGTLRCWGDPAVVADASAPPPGVVDVDITGDRVCGVVADGGVSCSPALLGHVPAAKHLSLSDSQTCVVTTGDQLDCFGGTIDGGGVIPLTGDAAAADVTTLDVTQFFQTSWVAFVLDGAGTLQSWGQTGMATSNLLGRATSLAEDDIPQPVMGLPAVRAFAAAPSHVCADTTDGRLFCWGSAGQSGLLGTGYSRDEPYPVEVIFDPGEYPYQVAVSDTHSCVRETDGRVACWGGPNLWGELGYRTRTETFVPVLVSALPVDIVSVAVGLNSSCALSREGAVYCWGDNRLGQLGQAASDDDRHPTPLQVMFK